MRVLDEVTAAVHAARYCFRPVHTATGLEEQFAGPITPRQKEEPRITQITRIRQKAIF